MTDKYNVSFRCFYNDEIGTHYNNHYNPAFDLADIPRWLDAYKFTHPTCAAISVKVWFNGGAEQDEAV